MKICNILTKNIAFEEEKHKKEQEQEEEKQQQRASGVFR